MQIVFPSSIHLVYIISFFKSSVVYWFLTQEKFYVKGFVVLKFYDIILDN